MKLASNVAFLILTTLCLLPVNADESVPRAYLGIWGIESKDAATSGVQIMRVAPNSPASKSDLKESDRILAVNDEVVNGYDQLRTIISNCKPGEEINLKISRDGQEQTFKLKLEEAPAVPRGEAIPLDPNDLLPGGPWQGMPEEMQKQFEEARQHAIENMKPRPMIGVQLNDLNDDLRERLKIAADVQGVVVSDVLADGPASKAGVQEEDVLTFADGKPIAHPADIQKIVAEKKDGETVTLQILRKGESMEKSVTIKMSLPMNEVRSYLAPGAPMLAIPDFQRHFAESEGRTLERIQELESQVKKLEERISVLEERISREAPTGESTLP